MLLCERFLVDRFGLGLGYWLWVGFGVLLCLICGWELPVVDLICGVLVSGLPVAIWSWLLFGLGLIRFGLVT